MQTITFYSYKGGVGRTLAVANIARYMARLGQKVFLVDFDLEAPGLHYKLSLVQNDHQKHIELGVLDYIYSFAVERNVPDSLEPYVVSVDAGSKLKGSIYLMPAGKVPCANYWRRLARINWHELFYSDQAEGIPFFLEFKERIEKDYAPDFLLVDSRTGVTEIGGVATSLWPDRLVCLLLKNLENLEGTRAVLRSVKTLERLPDQAPIEVLLVLTRIPIMEDSEREEHIIKEVRSFLNQEAEELSQTLNISDILVLHSKPELQIEESLSIGVETNPERSPLLRDYLRLCVRLISSEMLLPYIAPIVKEIVERALDDPDEVQRDLEVLAATCAHPEVYRTLLQFYRLRQADKETLLKTAWQYWDLHRTSDDPLLWEIVKNYFDASDYSLRHPVVPIEFIEAVWMAAGSDNSRVALALAKTYESQQDTEKAANILAILIDKRELEGQEVIYAINFFTNTSRLEKASNLVNRYKMTLSDNDEFQIAWAHLTITQGSREAAINLLDQPEFLVDRVKNNNMKLWALLLITAGYEQEVQEVLQKELSRGLSKGIPNIKIHEMRNIYSLLGKTDEFTDQVRKSTGEKADLFLSDLKKRETDKLIINVLSHNNKYSDDYISSLYDHMLKYLIKKS